MNQAQAIEWIVGKAEHEGFDIEELFQIYLGARAERKAQTGSLNHLLTQDYQLYEKLMQERTDYAIGKVRAYLKNKSASNGVSEP